MTATATATDTDDNDDDDTDNDAARSTPPSLGSSDDEEQ